MNWIWELLLLFLVAHHKCWWYTVFKFGSYWFVFDCRARDTEIELPILFHTSVDQCLDWALILKQEERITWKTTGSLRVCRQKSNQSLSITLTCSFSSGDIHLEFSFKQWVCHLHTHLAVQNWTETKEADVCMTHFLFSIQSLQTILKLTFRWKIRFAFCLVGPVHKQMSKASETGSNLIWNCTHNRYEEFVLADAHDKNNNNKL